MFICNPTVIMREKSGKPFAKNIETFQNRLATPDLPTTNCRHLADEKSPIRKPFPKVSIFFAN